MNGFDVALLSASFISALLVAGLPRRPVLALYGCAAAATAMAVGLYGDGIELRAVPIYLYVMLVAVAFRRLYRHPGSRGGPRLLGGFGIAASVLSAAALALTSVPPLPSPSGTYPVGVASVRLSVAPILRGVAYYPADLPGGYVDRPPRAPVFLTGEAVARVAGALGVPAEAVGHLRDLRSLAYLRAPLSKRDDSYPVVVLLPAVGYCSSAHFHLAAELSSRGLVVLSPSCGVAAQAGELIGAVESGIPDLGVAGGLDARRIAVITLDSVVDVRLQVDGDSRLSGSLIGWLSDVEAAGLSGGDFLDIDLLTWFPGLIGLPTNRVRERALPELADHLEAALRED